MEKHRNYYEGILQLRNPNKDILDFVYNLVGKRSDVSITKKEKIGDGFDLYLTSQRFLQHLGKMLKKHFHGELKISVRLHTRNRITGKNVYRVSVLFRMSEFRKGDIISYKGEKVKIIGIGKKVLAKEVKTGKKLVLKFEEIGRQR